MKIKFGIGNGLIIDPIKHQHILFHTFTVKRPLSTLISFDIIGNFHLSRFPYKIINTHNMKKLFLL